MRKVLYLGWIGFNNLGDEWMWEMFRDMAASHLKAEEHVVIPSLPHVEWKKVSQYDTIVLGGGSLVIPGYIDLVYEALELGKTTAIWGSGHDRLHKWVPSQGSELKPEPIDETAQYRQRLKAVMEQSVYCGIRGPWTREYIDSLGALSNPITISGDSAMLMNALNSVTVPEHVGSVQGKHRTIGINWGTSYNRIYGGDEAQVEDALARTCRSLLALGYNLHLYSVWGPDQEGLARLYSKLGHDESVTYDPKVYAAADYVRLLSEFEATINLKLHANLLSAAANVPFVCIGYRFKSFDLMHGLDLADWIVPTDDAQLADKLTEKVQAAAAWRDGYINKLEWGRKTAYQSLVTPFREGLF
ncbi:polysaccharide pyruvyl transferase family protein [Paenibacillus sp. CF384]|uniref:polysaccharide pyruvyl transferase family protein n=1 Tax=Paenibacillus sp. CF384 TaxID=1884382 RepID=UPI00089A9403|nr:polysaccharide pyruvyl transferase family protein [Paenibacillus sp. CF384]SDW03506.1 Polysaccharide pyruvyl transferase family protein WcaK [Paenibacillus sp. CF384]